MLKSLFLKRKAAASQDKTRENGRMLQLDAVDEVLKIFFLCVCVRDVLMVYNSFFANFDLGNIN